MQEFLEKYVPKKYWEAIDSYSYDGLDGHWIYLKDDYISTTTDCHTMHEYTIADMKKELKTIKKIS